MSDKPTCDYCGKVSEMVAGDVIYPHRPDLKDKTFYRCKPCAAHVGCHPGTVKPLGRLANAELRKAKFAAHIAFDPLWKRKMKRDGLTKGQARRAGYAWLSHSLGIPPEETHIGMFDIETCNRVIDLCRASSGRPA